MVETVLAGKLGKWGWLPFSLIFTKSSSLVPLLHCGLVGISLAPTQGISTVAGLNTVGNSSIWLKKLMLEPTGGWTPTVLFFTSFFAFLTLSDT